ncbi:unnamed protein product, partial [Meganyctiphanes norvegica]
MSQIRKITIANHFKRHAVGCRKEQQYDQAIELYSSAIELDDSVAIYYGNRSLAYLRTECFGYALNDATKALEMDKAYIKGYYRRASAHMSLGKFKLALKDYETVTKTRPNDRDAKMKYNECQKVVKMMLFQKAIAVDDDKKSIAESINLEAMVLHHGLHQLIIRFSGANLDKLKPYLIFGNKIFFSRMLKKTCRKYPCKILLDIKEQLMKVPTLVDITVPDENKFTVCGDIHGQYYDLMNIFELNGLPSEENPYLFNGDFVDRGSFSVECIFVLFGFKLLYPNHFFMSRGNHESATMNQMYGFEGEVKAKYTGQMAELFTEVYNWLPLCHCINSKILVMHGGLFSKDDVTLDDIRKTERNRQPPEEGIMCELLWSDPMPGLGRAPSKRGVGVQFGPDVTKKFLDHNDLDYVIRSHEVKADGYEVGHDGKCITVFSAPNYCDTMGNKGSFITLRGNDLKPKYTTYEAVPHPAVKPMAYANSILSMFS